MKRSIIFIAAAVLALASIVLAQSTPQAVLRTSTGDRPVSIVKQGEQTLFAADEVLAAFGGTITRERNGFKVKLGNVEAAFAPDSRFAVVREDLIEMPVVPTVVDNRAFVPAAFFDGYLRRSAALMVTWDPAANVLTASPQPRQAIRAQISVVDLPDLSKVVISLSSPTEYSVSREPARYLIRFTQPVEGPFAEQRYESPQVSRVAFGANEAVIELPSPDIAGDPYQLDNPFRIVLDLKKGVAPITQPESQLGGALKPTDLPGIRTIVLDPGHGGKEVGAIGAGGLMEKDATLAICMKLSELLQNKLGARVILTRYDDTLVSLDDRTALANQYKADLFLSVHLNAAVIRGARGAETYFLSLEASDELARKAAELENRNSGGTDSSSDLNLILWDLAQQDYMRESSRLAEVIQEEMNRLGNIQNRGVKQAPFRVLLGATMPAALVEVAFVSNPDEEAQLQTDAFQQNVATALLTAVERFKVEYETRLGIAAPKAAAAPSPAPAAPKAPAPTPQPTTTAASTRGR